MCYCQVNFIVSSLRAERSNPVSLLIANAPRNDCAPNLS